MRSLAGNYTIVARGDTLPPADAHVALMSLPMFFKTELDTIPATIPYLAAPGDKAALWRSRQKVSDKPKIGLVWAGNPEHKNDAKRSLDPALLLPLTELANDSVVSLQVGHGDTASRVFGDRVIDLAPELTSFAETAAAMQQLDLVISVDSSPAHLAGSLGAALLRHLYDSGWATKGANSRAVHFSAAGLRAFKRTFGLDF